MIGVDFFFLLDLIKIIEEICVTGLISKKGSSAGRKPLLLCSSSKSYIDTHGVNTSFILRWSCRIGLIITLIFISTESCLRVLSRSCKISFFTIHTTANLVIKRIPLRDLTPLPIWIQIESTPWFQARNNWKSSNPILKSQKMPLKEGMLKFLIQYVSQYYN